MKKRTTDLNRQAVAGVARAGRSSSRPPTRSTASRKRAGSQVDGIQRKHRFAVVSGGSRYTIENIATLHGTVQARAALNASLDPRVACGQHGLWQPCMALDTPGYDPFSSDGAKLNLVIASNAINPLSGTQPLKSYLCEIRLIVVGVSAGDGVALVA